MPKSYILPTFEAWALPLRNALLERLPVSFAFGKDLPAKLEVLPCAAAFAPAAELTLTIDGHPWRAYFENRALLPLHPLFDEAAMKDVAPESLPEPLLGLVAEALCGALTKSFSAAAGAVVRASDYRNGDGRTVSAPFALRLAAGDRETLLLVRPEETAALDAALALVGRIQSAPAQPSDFLSGALPAVPFRLERRAGSLRLSASEYAGLVSGDVLVPDEWFAGDDVRVEIASPGKRLLCACARIDNGRVCLAEKFQPLEETVMDAVEELTVELSFSLEERLVTLGELSRMRAGTVLPLTVDPAAPVTIRANGRRVAKGRLVDLNGTLGVELLEAAAAGPETAAAPEEAAKPEGEANGL